MLLANQLSRLTPLLLGEGLSGSPFPAREGGWGVRFSEFPNNIINSLTGERANARILSTYFYN
jgi:hypothetical protein